MIRSVFFFIMFLCFSAAFVAAPATASAPVSPVQAPAGDPEFIYDEHAQRDPFWPLVTVGGVHRFRPTPGYALSTFYRRTEALGLSRRMVSYYRTAQRPIPKTVWLECLGCDYLRQEAA